MANEVKIKLSADGSQVRNEIKLIDKELSELGGNSVNRGDSNKNSTEKPKSVDSSSDTSKGTEKVKQESRDKVNTELLHEMTLIRKELQKYNGSGGNAGTTSSGGSTTTSPSNNTQQPPSPNSPDESNSKLGDSLKKLASAAVALRAVQKAWGYVSSGAQSSYNGEKQAYQTFGSTLAYDDYYTAKRDSMILGKPYGYDYETVMNAGNTNMSKAGFTNLENYEMDMNAILRTSKAWGVDTSTLASASGYMSSIGVTQSGDQQRMANIFAQSIVDAGMTGRENEQLQVLQEISENLASVNTTVSEKSVTDSLQLYNALIGQDENLKGQRGSKIVNSLEDLATSSNSTFLNVLGFGSEYTGLEGKHQLEREIAENPEQAIERFYSRWMEMASPNVGEDYAREQAVEYLKQNTGLSISEIDKAIAAFENKEPNKEYDTTEGEEATEERNQNYSDSLLAILDKLGISEKDAKESAGHLKDIALSPLFKGYSNLSAGGQVAVDAAIGGVSALGINKILGKGTEKLVNGVKGLFGKGTSAVASSADDIVREVGEGVASSGEGALKATLNSTDDVLKATSDGASSLGKVGKGISKIALPAAVALEGVSTGIDIYNAEKQGDHRESAQELGGGIGSVAGTVGGGILGGMAAGAATGALAGTVAPGVGNVIGAVVGAGVGLGGALLGNKLGETAGEGIYDATHDKEDLTELQKSELQGFYKKVQDLYEEKGNNAAQDYTNTTIVPYLNSIGISKSITDDYKKDVGKPDFLKDIEKGVYGDILSPDSSVKSTDDNTTAINENTEQLKRLNNLDSYKVRDDKSDSLATDKGTNSDSLASNGDTKFPLWPRLWGTSHATGNNYVPYDNYTALLHRGEMVLTSSEADDYRQGKSGDNTSGSSNINTGVDININLNGEVAGMTKDNQDKIVEAVVSKIATSNLQNMISNGFVRVQNY